MDTLSSHKAPNLYKEKYDFNLLVKSFENHFINIDKINVCSYLANDETAAALTVAFSKITRL